jgi:hypothetical protein
MTREPVGESRLLRAALLGDSMLDGVMGLACILAAGPVAALLGLEAENATLRLRVLGIILVASGALLLWLSAQYRVYKPLVRAAIALNTLWIIVTLALAFGLIVNVSESGRAVLVAQAALLAVLTALQGYGLRRSPR